MKVAILLLASGRGKRMGTATPKVYLELGSRTILARSLQRLASLADDSQIVLAVHPEDRSTHLAPLLADLRANGLTDVVDGGDTRQESMQNALAACHDDRDLIVVHDAARPFFPVAATKQAMHRAADMGAALLAVPVPDTMKRVDDEFLIQGTVPREGIWLAQTPQIFRRGLLEAALQRALDDDVSFTDDVALLEHAGVPVEVVPSTPKNIKLTLPSDLELGALLAELEERAR